jgi:SAM-dependent methyltransferase
MGIIRAILRICSQEETMKQSFYESISAHYDLIFPFDPDHVAFIKKMAGPGGHILDAGCATGNAAIQVLNYDHIPDHGISELSSISNEHITFDRSYAKADSGLLNFMTRLTVKGDGRIIENEVLLYPLRKRELEERLRDAGFSGISFYGGFRMDQLREDSAGETIFQKSRCAIAMAL